MTAVEPAAEQPDTNRLAGGCVLVVLAAAAGGVVHQVPETGYFVAGLITTATIRKARGWAAGRRTDAEEPQPEPADELDVAEALRRLVGDDRGVLLTRLRDDLGLPDTRTVRNLLDAADIPIRAGVRTSAGNGPGVHRDDVPPLESPHQPRCLCRSDANTNTNNEPEPDPEKGLRVAPIGQAGAVVTDPAETQRRHASITR